MSKALESLDITGSPQLLALVEDVHRSGVGRLLKRGQQELAVLTPVAPRTEATARPHRRRPTGAESDAILNIVGIGESAEPTDVARHEQEYLAEAYTPERR